ncbi:hypothetical protein GCM10007415_35100 [Parapedobacter pyrenivorans]|uniref:RNA polymerase sigma-70 region 2 domain-containing protein n=1 Tax=Parapedobacter pyrenivorans TaxID=1305674 RepID=A0A917HYN4_9SPHI|nr:sigma-70 family RNA polymerase sigma factor [Parapedobacter pyrenivorans]GGG96808.1 hypothetical protein GCM10007415_35100 [Parapedobacter pyrenivorans]
MEKDSVLLDGLRNGSDRAIIRIYDAYKTDFIRFAVRYPLASEELLDIYQDAVIVLWERAQQGRLDALKSSIKTYLFGVGKYMILNRLKKTAKQQVLTDDVAEIPDPLYDETLHHDRVALLREGFQQLGDQCRKVLRLFYYEGKKLDEIQAQLGYTNKDVLKSQKSRCLKQLKELTKGK